MAAQGLAPANCAPSGGQSSSPSAESSCGPRNPPSHSPFKISTLRSRRKRETGANMRREILLLTAAALAVTPAAAQQLRTLDPRDVAEAQLDHAQLVQEPGGAD